MWEGRRDDDDDDESDDDDAYSGVVIPMLHVNIMCANNYDDGNDDAHDDETKAAG